LMIRSRFTICSFPTERLMRSVSERAASSRALVNRWRMAGTAGPARAARLPKSWEHHGDSRRHWRKEAPFPGPKEAPPRRFRSCLVGPTRRQPPTPPVPHHHQHLGLTRELIHRDLLDGTRDCGRRTRRRVARIASVAR
jgi:hypothetical protein